MFRYQWPPLAASYIEDLGIRFQRFQESYFAPFLKQMRHSDPDTDCELNGHWQRLKQLCDCELFFSQRLFICHDDPNSLCIRRTAPSRLIPTDDMSLAIDPHTNFWRRNYAAPERIYDYSRRIHRIVCIRNFLVTSKFLALALDGASRQQASPAAPHCDE